MKPKVKKIVVILCELDKNGKVATNSNPAPYGYHHIQKIYEDNSFWMIATVDSDVKEKNVLAIAKIIADEFDGSPEVEVDADFYKKNNK